MHAVATFKVPLNISSPPQERGVHKHIIIIIIYVYWGAVLIFKHREVLSP